MEALTLEHPRAHLVGQGDIGRLFARRQDVDGLAGGAEAALLEHAAVMEVALFELLRELEEIRGPGALGQRAVDPPELRGPE